MILMRTAINKRYFGGRRMLTCYCCHRGGETPRVTPHLAEQCSAPVLEEPDEVTEQPANGPSADQILDKYVQALGGTRQLASLTSFVARGTYQGYDDPEKRPLEIYAKAPDERTVLGQTGHDPSTPTPEGHSRGGAAPEAGQPRH